MKKALILIICFCLLVSGCGIKRGLTSNTNRTNLSKLEVGMTKEEVTKIMKVPFKTETFKGREFWFYYTAELETADLIHGVVYKRKTDFTPIGLINGKVEGWGLDYYKDKKEPKKDKWR